MVMHSQIFVLLSALVFFIHQCQCVTIGEEEHKVLQEVVNEFESSPTDPKFDNVIVLPIDKAHIIPKVFIWCPMMHFKVPLRCPVDNYPLKHKSFAKSLRLNKNKERAPRLIYDIGGNILLVQSYYVCSRDEKDPCHTFMSATPEIMKTLPGNIAKRLPLFLHYKSGFSNELLDYLIVCLSQGHTFQEITEVIASLNFRKFVERNSLAGVEELPREFYNNILYSFTSSDKLMHVFLWDFERKTETFQKHMNSIPCTTLVCDTSFKLDRRCKVKGSVKHFSKSMHLEHIFLGSNENGEVVLWRPMDQNDFEDLRDLLSDFKERLYSSGQELSAILVPDCCNSRALYQEIFPEVPVKMGIVHAIKTVTETLPKEHPDTQVFAHKLSRIFGSPRGPAEERTEESTSPLEIEANLDTLLTSWRSRLLEPTMIAIDSLRRHIRRGCLSGIPAGEGTEKIDNLHRHIQKSFLGRVTVLTPEMAFAIFTCLIYAWNCKKQIKNHYKGRKAIPLVPIEAHQNKPKPNPSSTDATKLDIKALIDQSVEPLIIECTQTTDNALTVTSMLVITVDVVEYMFARLLHIQELVDTFKLKCQKAFNVSDFPILSSTKGISYHLKLVPESSEKEINSQILQKNLAEYGLQKERVAGDGNCLFRSIVIQVQKLSNAFPDLLKYLESIGLGKSQEEDTSRLRELFVAELGNNFATYKDWVSTQDFNLEEDLEKFKQDGFFASDIGDLCIKACANLLQVPIIVIPSLPNVKFFPFLPTKFVVTTPAYVAYDHTAPGHYDATKEFEGFGSSKSKCRCGRNYKYKTSTTNDDSPRLFCKQGEQSVCPCAVANRPCVSCLCFNCQNKPTVNSGISCKCGNRKRPGATATVSCLNEERATCCCAKAGLSCSLSCSCQNCGNSKPAAEVPAETLNESVEQETPRKRSRKGIKQRSWASTLIKTTNVDSIEETHSSSPDWSEQEVISLMVCREVLEACNVEQNVRNISQVYRYIATSKNNKDLGLSIRMKNDLAILTKLQLLQTAESGIHLVAPAAMTVDTVVATAPKNV